MLPTLGTSAEAGRGAAMQRRPSESPDPAGPPLPRTTCNPDRYRALLRARRCPVPSYHLQIVCGMMHSEVRTAHAGVRMVSPIRHRGSGEGASGLDATGVEARGVEGMGRA